MDIEQIAEDIHRRLTKSGKAAAILAPSADLYKNYDRAKALAFAEHAAKEAKHDLIKSLKNISDADLKSLLYELMILSSH